MAAQAETTVNMFHSPDRDVAPQSEERFSGERRAVVIGENFQKTRNTAAGSG
jgi:hypothetical protein